MNMELLKESLGEGSGDRFFYQHDPRGEGGGRSDLAR
jgi:hypothetical protein